MRSILLVVLVFWSFHALPLVHSQQVRRLHQVCNNTERGEPLWASRPTGELHRNPTDEHQSVRILQNYIEERRGQSSSTLRAQKSPDERLANVVHLIHQLGVWNLNLFEFNSGNHLRDVDAERRVAGSKVNDELCSKHLNQMIKLMDEMQSELQYRRTSNWTGGKLQEKYLRLAQALDSFGHYESGYFSGKSHTFGSYNQCLVTRLDLADENLIGTRFCWAKLKLHKHVERVFKVNNLQHPLTVGICLPESCHTRSFRRNAKQVQKLVDSQFRLPQSIYVEENLQVGSIFCTVDSESQISIPTNGKLLLALLFTWLMLALLATLKRRQIRLMEDSKLKSALTCLDLKRSWLEFVGSTSAEDNPMRRVDLNTLNPVRCAGCAFVVWGHGLLIRIGYSMDQLHLPSVMETKPFGGFVIVGTLVVDTFFAISGIITCYLVMKKAGRRADEKEEAAQQSKESSTIKFCSSLYLIIKSRYMRLFPMLILFYWFKRSVFIYLGSGPLWDFGFNRETYNGACHGESWLVPFTFTSAFLPLSKQCLMQSWSVSNDMFFAVIFAPIMLVMTRKPKLAVSLAVVYCVASLQTLLNAIRALSPGERMPIEDLTAQGFGSMFSHVSHIYSYPTYRVTSYAIGMMAGYFLHHYNESNIKQWPRWFTEPATTFSLTYIAGVFLVLSNGGLIKPLVDPHHRIVFPYFMTLGKAVWAATNCVVFLRMMTDWNGNFPMRAGAGKFWQSMSKINYAILLLHFDLLIYDATATPQGNLNNLWTIFQAFSATYLVCLILAVVVYVLFENPIQKLARQPFFRVHLSDGRKNQGLEKTNSSGRVLVSRRVEGEE